MVGAGLVCIALVVGEAALHVLQGLSALRVSKGVSSSTEVAGEEVGEAGKLGGRVVGSSDLGGVGRSEKEGRHDGEALHIGVQQVAVAHHPGALEGVARDERRVSVVYPEDELERVRSGECYTYKRPT